MVAVRNTCIPNTWEMAAGDQKFKTNLDYTKPCLKKEKKEGQ